MFNPFPSDSAKKYALEFINELESGKSICDFNGMFGILVCRKKNEDGTVNQTGDDIVLKAFSGQYKSKWNYEGFVPALVKQDEYDKAVIENDRQIHLLSEIPFGETTEEKQLRDKKRIQLCNETLKKIYSLYEFVCFDGIKRNFDFLNSQIKFNANLSEEKLLPTGTGDCAAPKLLSYAFSKNLLPVSLAEFYWGKANTRFEHKKFYPPCDEKCRFILPAILGLEILYRDEHIIVVNKNSGLLSVPGRTPDKQDCAVSRVKKLFPECISQPSVHRLDMDTSGILVLTFTAEAQRKLSVQFQNGEIQKKYIGVIDGVLGCFCNFENKNAAGLGGFQKTDSEYKCGRVLPNQTEGQIELKFRLDVENRPHQIYDEVYGKLGITRWRKLRVWKMGGRNVTSIEFTLLTGRTHQLRLASASRLGFGIPIAGDNLYGRQNDNERLLLHSNYICFKHPVTEKQMEFFCEPDFKY